MAPVRRPALRTPTGFDPPAPTLACMSFDPQSQPDPYYQGQYPAPQMRQQPGLPEGMGMLRFTMSGSMLTNSMVAPTVTLDGYRLNVTSASGSFDFPVPAGQHRLHAHGQWMKTYGNADIDFTMQPGQFVEIFYAAPLHQFADKGAIGFTPQKKPGKGFMIGLIAAIIVIVVLLALLPLLL